MKPYVRQAHDKELRIGLVLYGGVSLAIYIYGVTYEFLQLARRLGPYQQLLEAARVTPVIDIISGSSAGGVNGIALAKALTTGADFRLLKDVWVNQADFLKLINKDARPPTSLLNSQFYIEQIEAALSSMNEARNEALIQDRPLDLFVTATNLDGEITDHVDPSLSQILQTKRYTSVFHLKTRPGSYNPFDAKRYPDSEDPLPPDDESFQPDLARRRRARNDFDSHYDEENATYHHTKDYFLARIAAATSAFPLAFAPVRFEAEERHAVAELFEADLMTGQAEGPLLFADGGMLDNKPFGYTIQTIFNRHADRPVDRKLFFVEPHPAAHDTNGGLAQRTDVDGVDTLLGWVKAKMDESIANDLQAVMTRNQHIHEVQRMLQWFETQMAAYLRAGRLKDKTTCRETYEEQISFNVYMQLKVDRLRQTVHEHLINLQVDNTAPRAAKWPKNWLARLSDEILDKSTTSRKEQINFLQQFDYPFRIRQIRYFITKINRWLAQLEECYPQPDDHVEQLMIQFGALKGRLYTRIELYTHATWGIWQEVEPVRPDTMLVTVINIRAKHHNLMERGYKTSTHRLLTRSFELINETVALLQQQPPDAAVELLAELAYFADNIDPIFEGYEFIDMHLYPLLVMADIGEADPIEVVRVSPQDATRYGRTVTEKLAGEQIEHFSGFLRPEWRKNDITWGRLDAAEIIVKTLLPDDPERQTELLNQLCPAIIKEELQLSEHYFKKRYRVGQEGISDIPTKEQWASVRYLTLTGLRLWAYRFEENRCMKWLAPLFVGVVGGIMYLCNTVQRLLRGVFGGKN